MKQIQANNFATLALGRQGENLARQVIFDVSVWAAEYGPGAVELVFQRNPGDTPYPIAADRDGNSVVWTVTSSDTLYACDNGRCELRYYAGETLVKSHIWRTRVEPAMGPAGDAPPEPEQGWVDQVLEAGSSAKEAADRAESAAKRAESAVPAGSLSIGNGLKWESVGKLAVDTADKVEQDNTKPVTSAAVHTEIGNIEILLQTI